MWTMFMLIGHCQTTSQRKQLTKLRILCKNLDSRRIEVDFISSHCYRASLATLQNMMLDIPLKRRSEIMFLDDEPFFDYIGNLPQCI